MSQVISSTIDSTTIQSLADRYNEPKWARDLREQAFAAFQTMPLPAKDEGWRNLRLRDVPLDSIIPYTEAKPLATEPFKKLEVSPAATLVHYNSEVHQVRIAPELEAKGVIFMSLQDAISKHADKVEKYLGKLYDVKESKFAALHYALRTGGMFLYIPKNVVIDQPIQVFTYADEANAGVFNHTLVVAEPFSQVSIIDYSASDLRGGQCVHSGAVEIFAEEGAKVSYIALQNFDSGVFSFNPRRARIGKNAEVKWSVSELGAQLARSENVSYLEGDGATSDAVVVFFGSEKQSLDVSAGMIHTGNHGVSDIVAKGVMKDQARTIWRGLGHIKQGAKSCKTYQAERSLLLSEGAKGDAIPGLLIEETDVLGAGHAAAVGRIDEEQLFYLMSRGITLAQAHRMIVEGFFGAVLDRIPVEVIRDEVYALIRKKLGDQNA
jgi:Fe-S cluster assembly protein SufD